MTTTEHAAGELPATDPGSARPAAPVAESMTAEDRLTRVLGPEAIDALLAEADADGLAVDGPGGLIQRMIGAVLERALETEMADHLGYDRGEAPEGGAGGNHRNGHSAKTVVTTAGPDGTVRLQRRVTHDVAGLDHILAAQTAALRVAIERAEGTPSPPRSTPAPARHSSGRHPPRHPMTS